MLHTSYYPYLSNIELRKKKRRKKWEKINKDIEYDLLKVLQDTGAKNVIHTVIFYEYIFSR